MQQALVATFFKYLVIVGALGLAAKSMMAIEKGRGNLSCSSAH